MEIKIIKGNITKLKVEAIVNATDKEMSGRGGVDLAIHVAAGAELAVECKILGGCETSEAKITKGYKLLAKYVIHTVGPVYGKENGKEAKLLADCYENCLKLAKEKGIRSIAFPAISAGVYGYPKDEAAQIAVAAINEFSSKNKNNFDEILFVLIDPENFDIYQKVIMSQIE
jgi:O-acetyl-ADP-ribose deacetylase (regulator of RNase III)